MTARMAAAAAAAAAAMAAEVDQYFDRSENRRAERYLESSTQWLAGELGPICQTGRRVAAWSLPMCLPQPISSSPRTSCAHSAATLRPFLSPIEHPYGTGWCAEKLTPRWPLLSRRVPTGPAGRGAERWLVGGQLRVRLARLSSEPPPMPPPRPCTFPRSSRSLQHSGPRPAHLSTS